MKTPYTLEETAEGLRATIPASEDYVVLWKLGGAWALWFMSGAGLFDSIARMISLYASGRSSVLGLILTAGSTLAFTPRGLRAFSIWSWSVYGEETLALGAETLSLTCSAVGLRRTQNFPVGDVRKLRVVTVPHSLDGVWPAPSPEERPARCAAAFESGGAEIRFAVGLERTQAETLVKHLISRCPGLGGS